VQFGYDPLERVIPEGLQASKAAAGETVAIVRLLRIGESPHRTAVVPSFNDVQQARVLIRSGRTLPRHQTQTSLQCAIEGGLKDTVLSIDNDHLQHRLRLDGATVQQIRTGGQGDGPDPATSFMRLPEWL